MLVEVTGVEFWLHVRLVTVQKRNLTSCFLLSGTQGWTALYINMKVIREIRHRAVTRHR